MDGMFNGGEDDIDDEKMWDFDVEGRASNSAPPPLSEKMSGGENCCIPIITACIKFWPKQNNVKLRKMLMWDVGISDDWWWTTVDDIIGRNCRCRCGITDGGYSIE